MCVCWGGGGQGWELNKGSSSDMKLYYIHIYLYNIISGQYCFFHSSSIPTYMGKIYQDVFSSKIGHLNLFFFWDYCANIINGRRLRLLTLSSTLLGESGNVVCEKVVCIALSQCTMQCKVIFVGIFSLISNSDYSITELIFFTNKTSFSNQNPRWNIIYIQNQYIIFENASKWHFKMPIIISGLQCRTRQVLV